jgi:hypothetical protein
VNCKEGKIFVIYMTGKVLISLTSNNDSFTNKKSGDISTAKLSKNMNRTLTGGNKKKGG